MGSSRLGGLLDERDEDWRDTLFYWHGKMSWLGVDRKVMSWRGTWLSSVESVAPPLSAFTTSYNFFELHLDVPEWFRQAHLVSESDASGSRFYSSSSRCDIESFLSLRGEYTGHYLMEPPDGGGYRRAYRDQKHEFCFASHIEHDIQAGPYVLYAARGQNEFGNFISLGQGTGVSRGSRSIEDPVEIFAARRYVRDDDSRWTWPLEQLIESIGRHPVTGSRIAPWEHSLPCRLSIDVIAESNQLAAETTSLPPLPPPQNEYEAMMRRKRGRS